MKCYECGRKMTEQKLFIENDQYLGSFALCCARGEYWKCSCGEDAVSSSLWKKLEIEKQARIEDYMIQGMTTFSSFDDLICSNRELVKLLGKSRQAIAKDGRIKTLIYHFTLKGKTYYWKKSAELFKRTGDGRIKLPRTSGKKISYKNKAKATDFSLYPNGIVPKLLIKAQ